MIRRIFGILVLGLLIVFGCSRGPMRGQTDASLPVTNSPPIDLNGALAQAKAQNKLVLLDFSGSDWCPPCIEMQKEIFSRPEFQKYAESNLVFLEVDFPSKFRLSDPASATNDFLSEKFDADGIPTLLALDGNGKELWRHAGALDGGLQELSTALARAKSKAK